MIASRISSLIVVAALLIASGDARASGNRTTADSDAGSRTVKVSGTGYDALTTSIVHSTEVTPTGMIQRSTQTVELHGDLNGRVLYHVTSVFDFVNGTLVNTGEQVYSGTIVGSEPVLIHDDQFRFEIDLVTGKDVGQVYLHNHIAGPKVRCTLVGGGTGFNADGNPTFEYTGTCTFRGK